MRHGEALPAWAARQRSRRLVRHSDEKVVRWINHSNLTKDDDAAGSDRSEDASSNDNVAAFSERSIQAS